MSLKYEPTSEPLQGHTVVISLHQPSSRMWQVGVRLPGKANSNSHGARPVHLIITMMKCIRTSRLSIKNSLSLQGHTVVISVHQPSSRMWRAIDDVVLLSEVSFSLHVSPSLSHPRSLTPSISHSHTLAPSLPLFLCVSQTHARTHMHAISLFLPPRGFRAPPRSRI